jgi:hypothetical protein
MPKIAEVKLSRCGLEVADFRKNCDCRATFLLKVAEFRLQKCFLQIAELRLLTQKNVARALLWILYRTAHKLCVLCTVILKLKLPSKHYELSQK